MIGHGEQFEYNSTGVTFVPVDGIQSVEFSGGKVDTLDNTDVSTVGNVRTYIGGLEDSGEVTIKMNLIPANASQIALRAQKDGAAHNFKYVYPGAVATESFSGIITGFDRSMPNDKPLE